MRVILNAVQVSASVVPFAYYVPVGSVTALTENIGPRTGGVEVILSGAGLAGGTEPTCRFRTIVVAATVSAVDGVEQLACDSPPLGGAETLDLSLSLNAQQYVSPAGLAFTYFSAISIQPPSGDTRGGMTVEVRGLNLGAASSYLLVFGGVTTVEGTYDADAGVVRALTPPATATGRVAVCVTIGGTATEGSASHGASTTKDQGVDTAHPSRLR